MTRTALRAPRTAGTDVSELATTLRIGVMRLERRLRSERTDERLTVSQLSALGVLARLGPSSPTQLAAAERVQPPSMTRTVAALEEMGLVRRLAHPSDGRQSVIALSEEGTALIARNRSLRQAWLVERLEELPAAERELLVRAAPILQQLAGS